MARHVSIGCSPYRRGRKPTSNVKLCVVLPISQSALSLCVGIDIPMLRKSVVGAGLLRELAELAGLVAVQPDDLHVGRGVRALDPRGFERNDTCQGRVDVMLLAGSRLRAGFGSRKVQVQFGPLPGAGVPIQDCHGVLLLPRTLPRTQPSSSE